MNKSILKKWRITIVTVVAMALVLTVTLMAASCSSPESSSSDDSEKSSQPENVVIGEFETITEPDMLADGTSGTAFQKGGDEELQQDRVTGGANTGGVASENLDPLDGDLTGPSEHSNPLPDLLEIGYPSLIPHELDGRDDCASCHAAASSEKPMPEDHVKANMGSNLCQTCHKK